VHEKEEGPGYEENQISSNASELFVAELGGPAKSRIRAPDQWRLSTELLNGVLIGYEMKSFADRKNTPTMFGGSMGSSPFARVMSSIWDTIDGSMTAVVRTAVWIVANHSATLNKKR